MKLSARNVIKGSVKPVKEGAPGIEMTAIISSSSRQRLDLAEGKEVYVMVKASNVMLSTD